MFGISFSEIILIFAVALIVLGPKQLPQIASRVGLIIYSIKNYLTSFKQELFYNSGVSELINTKNQLLKTYSKIRSNITPYDKMEGQDAPGTVKLTENQFQSESEPYQPELEFDRQPELFDKPTIQINMLEQSDVPMKQRETQSVNYKQVAMPDIEASIQKSRTNE